MKITLEELLKRANINLSSSEECDKLDMERYTKTMINNLQGEETFNFIVYVKLPKYTPPRPPEALLEIDTNDEKRYGIRKREFLIKARKDNIENNLAPFYKLCSDLSIGLQGDGPTYVLELNKKQAKELKKSNLISRLDADIPYLLDSN